MPTTLDTAAVRRSQAASQISSAPAVLYVLVVAVVVLAICGLAGSNAAPNVRTSDWPLGIAVPP